MKVVIDIPDGYVGVIMSNQRMEGSAMDKLIRQAIIDGTVLPKGHGDLIDRSKLDTRERGNNSQRCMWRNIKQIIENAPVVINADKENNHE